MFIFFSALLVPLPRLEKEEGKRKEEKVGGEDSAEPEH